MRRSRELLTVSRAEALFASRVATGTRPSAREVTDAVGEAVRRLHGCRGCAATMAYAYGEEPVTAAARMRWARATVEEIFGGGRPGAHR